MIDMNFINFFIRTKYDLSLEEYYNVQKSTVSNWRKRKIPKKYIDNLF
jgi:DNA-binding transcriptional regulator YiaG